MALCGRGCGGEIGADEVRCSRGHVDAERIAGGKAQNQDQAATGQLRVRIQQRTVLCRGAHERAPRFHACGHLLGGLPRGLGAGVHEHRALRQA